jgi:hypothetical protein
MADAEVIKVRRPAVERRVRSFDGRCVATRGQ